MQQKEQYLSPSSETHELRLVGVIAASGNPQDYINPFGDEQDF